MSWASRRVLECLLFLSVNKIPYLNSGHHYTSQYILFIRLYAVSLLLCFADGHLMCAWSIMSYDALLWWWSFVLFALLILYIVFPIRLKSL